jgi:hypothetical protein
MTTMKQIVLGVALLLCVTLLFQNCGKGSFKDQVGEATNDSLDNSEGEADEAISCYFDGENIPDGEGVMAFQNPTVPSGSTCIYEKRECVKGNLSGSYNYATCQVNVPSSCLFNGRTIPSGTSVTAFQNGSAAASANCVSQTRTCTNGKLSGSYNYSLCSETEYAGCVFNGRPLAHNETVKAFLASTTAVGAACKEETRKCVNGALSGSYSFSACTPGLYKSCSFNGKSVAHGEAVTAYYAGTAAACVSESRVCKDGILTGTYAYMSCTVSSVSLKSCLFNGKTIAHGEVVKAYPKDNVGFGEACDSEARECVNGALTGTAKYSTCGNSIQRSCFAGVLEGNAAYQYQKCENVCAGNSGNCNCECK